VNARTGRLQNEKKAEEAGRFVRRSMIYILRKELELSEWNSVIQKAEKKNEGALDGQKVRMIFRGREIVLSKANDLSEKPPSRRPPC
jgi:hypothetical protein